MAIQISGSTIIDNSRNIVNAGIVTATTFSGDVALSDGSVSAPSIKFSSSTTTGIYSPGSNQLSLVTAGTGRITIDASGNVVAGGTLTAGSFIPTSSSVPTNGLYSPGTNQLALSTNGTGRLFVDASGRVGIGVTPTTTLQVKGSFRLEDQATSPSLAIRDTDAAGDASITQRNSGDFALINSATGRNVIIENGGSERLRITSTGLLGLGTSAPSSLLHLAAGGIHDIKLQRTGAAPSINRIANETDLLVLENNTQGISLKTGTTPAERIRISSTGLVGIGTSDPASVGGQLSAVCNGNLGPVYLRNLATSGITADQLQVGVAQSTNLTNFFLARYYSAVTTAPNVVHYVRGDGQGYFAGSLGIGTTSPAGALSVKVGDDDGNVNAWNSNYFLVTSGDAATSHALGFGVNTASNYSFISSLAPASAWKTLKYKAIDHIFEGANDAERARIDSSGRLLVGTSSDTSGGNGNALLQVVSSGPGRILPGRSDGNTAADLTIGAVDFRSFAGSVWESVATITALSDGVSGSGDKPGRLVFSTTADGASSPTERMRIDSSGRVGIGTTSPQSELVVRGSTPQITLEPTADTQSCRLQFALTDGTVQSGVYGGGVYGQNLVFVRATGETARIDTSGRLLVGTSSSVSDTFGASLAQVSTTDGNVASFGRYSADAFTPIVYLRKSRGSLGAQGAVSSGDGIGALIFTGSDGTGFIQGAAISAEVDGTPGANDMPGRLVFSTTPSGSATPVERMRITSNGEVLFGVTSNRANASSGLGGHTIGEPGNAVVFARQSNLSLIVNRITDDGDLVQFKQDGTAEGSISVSGTTVSYNGAHLSRWSQLPSGAERTEILRGSVLSNIDEMCEWGEEDNEQLNRMKVSDVEGDKNVSGVFQAWDDDDDTYTNDFYCAMTGDFIIRIGAGVTVERGDLLMSAGDGTAKPQDDDIIRSKTIAKVTSTNVSCTYDDGSYCVPCVLMAC